MKNFNLTRFLHLLKYDLFQYRKQYISFTIGSFVGLTLGQLGVFYPTYKYGYAPINFSAFADTAVQVFYLFFFMMLTIAAANVFAVLPTKRARISYLMLPASNLEKYLSRLLICLVFIPFITFLCFVVADGIRILVYLGSNLPVQSVLPALWNSIVYFFNSAFATDIKTLILSLQSQALISAFIAFFIVGSVLFNRRAAIITWLIMVLLNVISVMIVVNFFEHSSDDILPIVWRTSSLLFFILLTVVFVGLAYRLFCRKQVTRRTLF